MLITAGEDAATDYDPSVTVDTLLNVMEEEEEAVVGSLLKLTRGGGRHRRPFTLNCGFSLGVLRTTIVTNQTDQNTIQLQWRWKDADCRGWATVMEIVEMQYSSNIQLYLCLLRCWHWSGDSQTWWQGDPDNYKEGWKLMLSLSCWIWIL